MTDSLPSIAPRSLVVCVRIDDQIRRRLEKAAKQHKTDRSSLMRSLICHGLDQLQIQA